MRTSITEIIRTEKFLRDQLRPEDRLVFQAKLLVDDELRRNTIAHRIVHRLVKLYQRRRLKLELENLQVRLFNDPANDSLRESATLFKS